MKSLLRRMSLGEVVKDYGEVDVNKFNYFEQKVSLLRCKNNGNECWVLELSGGWFHVSWLPISDEGMKNLFNKLQSVK